MKKPFIFLIVTAIVIRVVTFIFSANYGSDSINRIFYSVNWINDPFFITGPNTISSIWLPLQFYINGAVLLLWDNPQLAPRLVSLIISLSTLSLFFGLCRRLFTQEESYLATAIFAFYPLHIKFGNIAAGETLYVFTMVAAFFTYYRLVDRKNWTDLLLLIISLNAATMARFESWLLPPFLAAALLIRAFMESDRDRRFLLTSGFATVILGTAFMTLWTYGSYHQYGDPLYSLHIATKEHTELTAESIGAIGSWKTILYNAAFWPAVLLVSLSPLVFVAALWGAVKSFIARRGLEIIALVAFQMSAYAYQSVIGGDLAPLARYTVFIGTGLCFFSGVGAIDLGGKLRRWFGKLPVERLFIATVLIWTVALCYDYLNVKSGLLRKLSSVSPITMYPAGNKPVIEWLRQNLGPEETVMFNTPGYASNSIILYARLKPGQVVAVKESSLDSVVVKLQVETPNYIILHKAGSIQQALQSDHISDSLDFRDFSLILTERVGDFGIYRANFNIVRGAGIN